MFTEDFQIRLQSLEPQLSCLLFLPSIAERFLEAEIRPWLGSVLPLIILPISLFQDHVWIRIDAGAAKGNKPKENPSVLVFHFWPQAWAVLLADTDKGRDVTGMFSCLMFRVSMRFQGHKGQSGIAEC